MDRWLARFARPWPAPACAGAIAASGLALAPMFLPCLPPETLIRYREITGVEQPRIENHRLHRWAAGPCRLRVFPQGDHHTLLWLNEEEYFDEIRAFVGGLDALQGPRPAVHP